jgi:hypothetical protein
VCAALLSASPASAAPPPTLTVEGLRPPLFHPEPVELLFDLDDYRVEELERHDWHFARERFVPAPEPHRFWDRRNWLGLAVHGAARAVDVHSSCRAFKRGREEMRLPVDGCGGVAAWSAGAVGVELGLRWWLHKKGKHGWERWLPYLFAAPAAVEAGFNYRF